MSASINLSSASQEVSNPEQQPQQAQGQGLLGNMISSIKNCNRGMLGLGLLMLAGQASGTYLKDESKPEVRGKINNVGSEDIGIQFNGKCNLTNENGTSLEKTSSDRFEFNAFNIKGNESATATGTEDSCSIQYLSATENGNVTESTYKDYVNKDYRSGIFSKKPDECSTLKIWRSNQSIIDVCETNKTIILNKEVSKNQDENQFRLKTLGGTTKIKFVGNCTLLDSDGNKTSKNSYDRYDLKYGKEYKAIPGKDGDCKIKSIVLMQNKNTCTRVDRNVKEFSEKNCETALLSCITKNFHAKTTCNPTDFDSPVILKDSPEPPHKYTNPTIAAGTIVGMGTLVLLSIKGSEIIAKYRSKGSDELININLSPDNRSVEEYEEFLKIQANKIVGAFVFNFDRTDRMLHNFWDSLEPIKEQLSEVQILVETEIDSDSEAANMLREINFGGMFGQYIHDGLLSRIGQVCIDRAEASYQPKTNLTRFVESHGDQSLLLDFLQGTRSTVVDAGNSAINYALKRLA